MMEVVSMRVCLSVFQPEVEVGQKKQEYLNDTLVRRGKLSFFLSLGCLYFQARHDSLNARFNSARV